MNLSMCYQHESQGRTVIMTTLVPPTHTSHPSPKGLPSPSLPSTYSENLYKASKPRRENVGWETHPRDPWGTPSNDSGCPILRPLWVDASLRCRKEWPPGRSSLGEEGKTQPRGSAPDWNLQTLEAVQIKDGARVRAECRIHQLDGRLRWSLGKQTLHLVLIRALKGHS